MSEIISLNIPKHPKIAQNIVYFARALRRAGLPIGTGHVIVAVEAVRAIGFSAKKTSTVRFMLAL